MDYKVINNLPIDYEFSTKTKQELKLYYKWFLENKEIRIYELSQAVKSTLGFENWNFDFSPNSLKELGLWLKENIITEKISESEYKKKRADIPNFIELSEWDLTIRTRSLLVDIGIYLGEVFIHVYPSLKWEQYFSLRKNDNDQGHIVIKMVKNTFNPIWVTYIIGLGLADNTKNELSLLNSFETWSKYMN